MRSNKFGMMFSAISMVLGIGSASLGQSVVTREVATQNTQVASAARNLSFNFVNTQLAAALDELAQKSGMKITYSGDAVAGKKIAAHGEKMELREALARVLTGTKLMVVTEGSQFIIIAANSIRSGRSGQGVITGRVTDAKTGKTIAGANVSVGPDSRVSATGEDGSYRLTGIPAGVNTVTVRLVGYAKQVKSITLGESATVTVDFKLEPSANVLDQVVVTGTVASTELKSVSNAITVVTAKQIEERGITRIDQLFRGDIPGLFAVNRGSDAALDEVTMFSRGATALSTTSAGTSTTISTGVSIATFTNPIKTYVDGVEMVDPKYLSQIDPSSIERIEIISGPQASTIYGSNAINGVMQIFTKRGSGGRPSVSLNLVSGVIENNFSDRFAPEHIADARLSGAEGRWNYNIGGSWNYIGPWTPSKQTDRYGVNGGNRIELRQLSFDLSGRSVLTRNKQKGDPRQGIFFLREDGIYAPNSTTGLPVPETRSLSGQALGSTISYRPFSWWLHNFVLGSDVSTVESLRTGASYVLGSSDTALSYSYSIKARTSERYATILQLPASDFANLSLTLGADHWRTTGSLRSASPASLTGTLGNPSITRLKPGKNRGAFAQGQLALYDALFFTYGLRADWNPNFGDKAKVKPGRYGLSYARELGNMSVKLRGSYGRSIRPPDDGQALAEPQIQQFRIDLFGPHDDRLANPNLGPEHQQGGEWGIEVYIADIGSLVVTRYNQTVDNLISIAGNGSTVGIDSIRSSRVPTTPLDNVACTSTYRDPDGYCYFYQREYLNVGSIRNQGWELQTSINTGPITTRGTYSWTKSRVLGVTPAYRAVLASSPGFAQFTPGLPFKFVPEHTWALGVTYSRHSSTIALNVNGAGMIYKSQDELRLLAAADVRLPYDRPRILLPSVYVDKDKGYATADLNASHSLGEHVDGVLQIINVTDFYRNDLSAWYATMGRQSKIGMRIRW